MRNIQVINVRWFNATAYYALTLAKAMQDAGHETLVLALEGTESCQKAMEMGLKVETINLNSKKAIEQFKVFAKLEKIIMDFKPEIVNCHRGEAFIYFALLKIKYSYKLVRTRGDQRLPKNNSINRYLYNKASDAVISTNSKMYNYLLEQMHTPKSKLFLILGGTDKEKFAFSSESRERIRSVYNYKAQDFVLTIVGRFDYVKGQKEFIEIFAELHRKGYGFKLLLVGFSTEISQQEIMDLIRDYGLEEHIQITGKVHNVEDYYSACDLGIISSLYSESIARVAFEFIAAKLAVLATQVGVLPDLFSPKALVQPDNLNLLVDKIILAYELPAYKEELLAAQNSVDISLDYFLGQSIDVYNKCLNN